MIDERAYRATNFWREIQADIRRSFDGPDESFDRACLHALFMVAVGRGIAANVVGLDFAERARALEDVAGETAFLDLWRMSASDVRNALGIRIPEDVEHAVSFRLYRRLLEATEQFADEKEQFPAYFDHKYLSIAARKLPVNLLGSHFTAVLSNTLAGKKHQLIDAFCTTGELFATSGGERWRRNDARQALYFQQTGHLDAELRMRLALHGVAVPPPERIEIDHLHSITEPFVLIDATQVPKTLLPNSNCTLILRSIKNPRLAATSLQMLDCLLQAQGGFEGVVVVSGQERRRDPAQMKGLRQFLVERGTLAAVIDLPGMSGPGTRAQRSAWVLRNERSTDQDKVLMVDLRTLTATPTHQELGALAEFAGRLIRRFENAPLSSRWATVGSSSESDRLRELFTREFGNGYRDVPGLCSAVSHDQLAASGFQLLAAAHLHAPEGPSFLSGIDGKPVIRELGSSRGKTIYIIGNNGEGKSLLLRELAQHASSIRKRAVGVAFGLTDRFPLDSASEDFSTFVYEGERTSSTGMSAKKSAELRVRKMLEIHRNERRFGAFNQALSLMEFDARRFIVPLGPDRRGRGLTEIERVHELSGPHFEELTVSGAAGMEVAFMRKRARGEITAFSELSSGEQQMISIALRLAASSEPGCLVLVDEPEVSMHVSWQRLLPALFREFRERFHCDIVVATHSPLVVSSTQPPDDVCFAARRQVLEEISERDIRSVEGVLFHGFGTHTENNRSVHEGCAALVAEGIRLANMPNSDPRLLRQLRHELAGMRKTVLRSNRQIDAASLATSLELIDKAQAALKELGSWRDTGHENADAGVDE